MLIDSAHPRYLNPFITILDNVQMRAEFFDRYPHLVPKCLDPQIEMEFDVPTQNMRSNLFCFLANLKIDGRKTIIKASSKKNAERRISNYKGVIINGKNWEVRYFFFKQKNYLC